MNLARGIGAAAAVTAATAGLVVAMVLTGPGQTSLVAASPTPSPSPSPSVESSPSPSPSPSPGRDEQFLAWGPSLADWDDALATAQALPVESAAGQVIVASYSGTSSRQIRLLVDDLDLGGVILMGDSFPSRDAVAALAAGAQAGGPDRDWPVIVSVDQEGGTVARLAGLVPDLPAFMAAGSMLDKQMVTDAYASAAVDMGALGFTVNYAPVADVTIGPADPVIRSRSAGGDPENVARTVVAAMQGYVTGGVVPVVKHFPGHGSVTTDSHAALPVQTASVVALESRDLVPFARAIDAGAPAVMMSHVAVGEWGGGPSTLAPGAYSYLRDELGFTGVAITDALNMRAVVDTHGPARAATTALTAGADVLLMPEDVPAAHAGIVAAVADGSLPRARLDEAAARSILLARWQAQLEPERGLDGDYARIFAGSAATVVTPLCGTSLVGSTVQLRGGFRSERDAVAAGLAQHGVTVGSSGAVIELVGSPTRSESADVVVAMDGPWGLAGSRARTYVALYGRSDDALLGLADVLAGASAPRAQWPVPIGGLPYGPCPSPR